MGKFYQWKVQDEVSEEFKNRFPELAPIVVQMLANRDILEQEEVDRFLHPDYGQDQHDPYLFRDMKKAIDRISIAIEKEEKVTIHGDYDADGVCASSVLYITLKKLGVDVDVYIPHRDKEGYGLNMNTVQLLKKQGTDLIITVDCGISNKPEVERAVEEGMDVIITDHHSQPPELPDAALAVIDPKLEDETYPFDFLAGVGVSFKVCQALIKKYELGEAFEKWLLDLVAISTVTDFVELIGENRVFLKYGLVVLQKNQRLGLQKLYEAMAIDPTKIDAQTIGFKIGPHINAAGRIHHANMAFELMVEKNPETAVIQASDLIRTNRKRQSLSLKMSKEAEDQARLQKDEYVIVVESEDWPVGLVGLVAGRISSKFNRPTLVITKMGDEMVGSGRSIEHFNMIEGLQSMDELFTKYGGHPMACGFSLASEDNLSHLKKRLRELSREKLEGRDLRNTLKIEKDLALHETNWDLIDIITQFAPYGQANPEPLFCTYNVVVEEFQCVGKNKDHLRMVVSEEGMRRQTIAFQCGEFAEYLEIGKKIDIVYTVGVNEWNGNRSIQLLIKDIEVAS